MPKSTGTKASRPAAQPQMNHHGVGQAAGELSQSEVLYDLVGEILVTALILGKHVRYASWVDAARLADRIGKKALTLEKLCRQHVVSESTR